MFVTLWYSVVFVCDLFGGFGCGFAPFRLGCLPIVWFAVGCLGLLWDYAWVSCFVGLWFSCRLMD